MNSFFVFPILIPSFKLLYLSNIRKCRLIHKNSHEDLDPHPLPKLKNCSSSYIVLKSLNCFSCVIMCTLAAGSHEPNPNEDILCCFCSLLLCKHLLEFLWMYHHPFCYICRDTPSEAFATPILSY
jgi:hypothetical protein